jgi:hypothetical protein
MIHYQLQCDRDHAFDGWFKDIASFDRQANDGLISCPRCNSIRVSRALMAPALGRGSRQERETPLADDKAPVLAPATGSGAVPALAPPLGAIGETDVPDHLRALLLRLRSEVEKHCDHVGTAFAEEARRIHYGEVKARAIYGETTPSEAEALTDEGIEFGIVPWLRRPDG